MAKSGQQPVNCSRIIIFTMPALLAAPTAPLSALRMVGLTTRCDFNRYTVITIWHGRNLSTKSLIRTSGSSKAISSIYGMARRSIAAIARATKNSGASNLIPLPILPRIATPLGVGIPTGPKCMTMCATISWRGEKMDSNRQCMCTCKTCRQRRADHAATAICASRARVAGKRRSHNCRGKISVVLSTSSKLALARADTDFVPLVRASHQPMLKQGSAISVLD